jgi:hypothetical protein
MKKPRSINQGKKRTKRTSMLFSLAVITVILLNTFIYYLDITIDDQGSFMQNNLTEVDNNRQISTQDDMFLPVVLNNVTITINLHGDLFVIYFGISKGHLTIEHSASNYSFSTDFDLGSGGTDALKTKQFPGNYSIRITGQVKLMLADNSISEYLWMNNSDTIDTESTISSFTVPNTSRIGLALSIGCNSSFKLYIYNDILNAISSDTISDSGRIVKIFDKITPFFVIIVVQKYIQTTTITVNYSVLHENSNIEYRDAIKIGWLIFVSISILILVYIYNKHIRQSG